MQVEIAKGDYVGSKARFKIDEAVSNQGNSANIKLVAVGPTVGFQLREWGNITYRLRILVADSTINNEFAMSSIEANDATTSVFVYVNVLQVNAPPVFQNCNVEREVSETSAQPLHQDTKRIMPNLIASDGFSGQQVQYSIVDGDWSNNFRLEHDCTSQPYCTARIFRRGDVSLDYETLPPSKRVSFTVRVEDNGPGTKFNLCAVDIVVVNFNEVPFN